MYKEIRLEKSREVQWLQEVILVSGSKSELLNAVYKEISEKLGMDTAMSIYQMFKGQQINFPVRFFNPTNIRQIIDDSSERIKKLRKMVKGLDGLPYTFLIGIEVTLTFEKEHVTTRQYCDRIRRKWTTGKKKVFRCS